MAYKNIEDRAKNNRERRQYLSQFDWYRDKVNLRGREWRKLNPKHVLRLAAKRRAERDGMNFDISVEDIPDIPEICPIALIPIYSKNDGSKGPSDNSPTLDRIDTTKGYVKGNIQVLSHKGNRWKSDMTLDDMERMLNHCRALDEAFKKHASV